MEKNNILTSIYYFFNKEKFCLKIMALYTLFKLYFYIKVHYLKNLDKNRVIKTILSSPFIGEIIKSKLISSTKILENDLKSNYKNLTKIPDKGLDNNEISTKLALLPDSGQKKEQISGIIYHGGVIHKNRLVDIFRKFAFSNPLHPDVFPKIREMEIDVINMAISLFKGDENCSGNITYGGTESILLACITYRDYYKSNKGITNPNIVALESVHPAFDKACHYFNICIKKVPININTGTSSIELIEKYIDENTILLVGSAPSYAHGIIDPIVSMSQLVLKYDISFHLDCCMGGFLIPFIDNFKHINFKLKGISSISLDTHKYGNTLKGSSIILYRNYNIKKYQHFINKDWNGGIYCTPTIMGSKSGGLIAAAWASILYMGKNEYSSIAQKIKNNVGNIRYKMGQNKNIVIIGRPNINIVAFRAPNLNIYNIANEMKKTGWNISIMQNPAAFHICLTNLHTKEICDRFCKDLNSSIDVVIKNKNNKLTGTLALYGSSQEVGANLFIEEVIHDFIFLLSRKSISERY